MTLGDITQIQLFIEQKIRNIEAQFNPATTPATHAFMTTLYRLPEYVMQYFDFVTQPQSIQQNLIKHALLHNHELFKTLRSLTKTLVESQPLNDYLKHKFTHIQPGYTLNNILNRKKDIIITFHK